MLILLIVLNYLVHEQTNWMGGAGLKGPVADWGTGYFTGDSITTAIQGQVSLVANNWNYTNWIRHDLDTNSAITEYIQGFMPGNINNDNLPDLVAYVADSVWWYQNDGNWNYTKHLVGQASARNGGVSCTYVIDMDNDGDDDILAATDSLGLGWFENHSSGSSWVYHNIAAGRYHRVCAVDIDLDGDIDVVATDNSRNVMHGNIYLFRRNGATTFSKETIRQFQFWDPDQAWRVYTADFNNDKYPDVYAVGGHAYIFLNKGTSGPGQFDLTYLCPDMGGNIYVDWDGAWTVDINMDGWMDLVTANFYDSSVTHPYGFYGHINDGTGNNYTPTLLTQSEQAYMSGSMATDLDLDGLPDIVGTYQKVGWFKQTYAGTFQKHLIDSVMKNNLSHWIYATELNTDCMPRMDLLVTDKGAHIIYENKTVNEFANTGRLESSVLMLGTIYSGDEKVQYFGWDACATDSTTLQFYWRTTLDTIADSIFTQPWNGPYYAVKSSDTISLSEKHAKFFQYKVEFKPTINDSEIATLYRVWLKDTVGVGVKEEKFTAEDKNLMKIAGDKILLSVAKQIDNSELSVYNSAGQKIAVLYKGLMNTQKYTFIPKLKTNGVYLIVLSNKNENNNQRIIASAKLVKYR